MEQAELTESRLLAKLLQVAVEAASEPADMILKYFHDERLFVEKKQDDSPVTQADREAEQIIRDKLAKCRTSEPIDILGEEQGLAGQGARFRWTIDPIDGTRSFVKGVPLFGTIIALEDTLERRALLGVIHLPVFQMTYSAARGNGSWCNGKRLSIPSVSELKDAIVSTGDPLQFAHAKFEDAYHRLLDLCPCLRGYSDCFGHTLVASGAVGAMIDPDLNPWDVLATQVIVEEAGGMMMMRPSSNDCKVDALFGSPDLVRLLAKELKF